MYFREFHNKFCGLRRRLDPEIVEMEKRLERQKGLATGLILGSVLASITTLLLAPDSGKNNRQKAREELEKTREILEANIVEGKKKLSQIYDETKEAIVNKKRALEGQMDYDDNDGMNVLEEDFDLFEEDLDLFEDEEADTEIED